MKLQVFQLCIPHEGSVSHALVLRASGAALPKKALKKRNSVQVHKTFFWGDTKHAREPRAMRWESRKNGWTAPGGWKDQRSTYSDKVGMVTETRSLSENLVLVCFQTEAGKLLKLRDWLSLRVEYKAEKLVISYFEHFCVFISWNVQHWASILTKKPLWVFCWKF